MRPLTTDANFRLVIPRASLGSLRWFQTNVCLGTNMRFITAIQSLANLSPDATFVSGGSLPGRWWGLLPSIPRIAWFPGRGFVLGPYITSRSQDSAGNAVITFRVPFVAGLHGPHDRRQGRVRPQALGLDGHSTREGGPARASLPPLLRA